MKAMNRQYNLLLVSSSGGVLLDLLGLKPWWSRHPTTWALVKAEDTLTVFRDQRIYWIKERLGSRPWELVAGVFDALSIIRRVRPDIIVSAGSGVAVCFFGVARFLKIPTFWVETFNMVQVGGISSQVCSMLASEVLVQRASLLGIHPGAILIGELY
jgi:hypothetical protein